MPQTTKLEEQDMGVDLALATKRLRRMCTAVSDTYTLECTARSRCCIRIIARLAA